MCFPESSWALYEVCSYGGTSSFFGQSSAPPGAAACTHLEGRVAVAREHVHVPAVEVDVEVRVAVVLGRGGGAGPGEGPAVPAVVVPDGDVVVHPAARAHGRVHRLVVLHPGVGQLREDAELHGLRPALDREVVGAGLEVVLADGDAALQLGRVVRVPLGLGPVQRDLPHAPRGVGVVVQAEGVRSPVAGEVLHHEQQVVVGVGGGDLQLVVLPAARDARAVLEVVELHLRAERVLAFPGALVLQGLAGVPGGDLLEVDLVVGALRNGRARIGSGGGVSPARAEPAAGRLPAPGRRAGAGGGGGPPTSVPPKRAM